MQATEIISDRYSNENIRKLSYINQDIHLIKRRIEDNIQNSILESCGKIEYPEKDAVVIELNLERATNDNFKIFVDYVDTINYSKYKNYVLDLSDALFMDSVFLGSVIMFYKKITKLGGSFSIIINKEKIKILTAINNLSKILNVHINVKDAIGCL